MPVAYNPDTNEAMVLDPETGWIPTKLAVNPDTGDRMAFDGSAWVPIKAKPTPNPAAAAENQWRQGNRMPPIGQPPERKLAETPGGLLVSTALQAKEKWDNFKAPDLSLLGSPSNERDDPNRGPAFEESLKLMPFVMPGGPPIARGFGGGRVAGAIPESPISPNALKIAEAWRPPPPSGAPPVLPGGPPEPTMPPGTVTAGPNPIVPPPPPLPVEPVVRPRTGARLLPPETLHSLPPEHPDIRAARASVGAAASGHGPLSDLSPGAENLLRKAIGQEGLSPYMVEQRISEMSPHQFLAEVSPNMQSHASGLHASGGAARNEIEIPFVGRKAETPQRMGMLFDEALGKDVNGVQFMRSLKDARATQSAAAWREFQQTPIPPFPGMAQLMDRLDAAGALRHATKAQREWGRPVNNQFKPGPASSDPLQPGTDVPTAGTFQFAKEHLDTLIKTAIEKGRDGDAARYSAMKNALVSAIDNHPDTNVAGRWRAAREAWTGPSQLMSAHALGERLLTGHINKHQLPIITESYGPRELEALAAGVRSDLENRLGRPGPQELSVIKQVLGKNNQEKIAHVIGDDKAEKLFAAILHEHSMHFSHDQTIRNSMTAARTTAQKFWEPPESAFPGGGIPTSLRGAGRMAIDATLSHVAGKRNAQQAAQFEKIREEVARIMTLQGAERDAALHYLTTPKPSMRVVGSP